MNKQNLNFFINENIQIDLLNFVISLICVSILCLLIQLCYIRFSSTLSNRIQFSKNFVTLGVATCIVITIVKSSLALSLGLVGALSIVRFRAAIKEPEELVYLFLVISAGLGCGANVLTITITGVVFSLLIIIIYSLFIKRTKITHTESVNLAIIIDQDLSDSDIEKIIDQIKNKTIELNFVSMSRTVKNTNINLDIKPKDFKDLIKITNSIKDHYKDSKVIVARSSDLSL